MNTNAKLIRECIFQNPGANRKELQQKTGLDIRTVSTNVRKLERQGFVFSRYQSKKGAGRKCAIYFPTDKGNLVFAGIYVELQEIICVFKDVKGNILDTYREPFMLDWASLNHTAKRIGRILTVFSKKTLLQVNSIGISIRERRGDQFSTRLLHLLKIHTGLPVYGGRPIDAFAWSIRMQFPRLKKIAIVHFGMYKLELCVVNGMKQLEGISKFEQELSHMEIDPEGPECYCGQRGCLEYYVHGYAMEEEYREIKGTDPREEIDLAERFLMNEPAAVNIVKKAESSITSALLKIHAKFKPDMLVLLVLSGDTIIRSMKLITDGQWLASGKEKPLFHVHDLIGKGGLSCAAASADGAIVMTNK